MAREEENRQAGADGAVRGAAGRVSLLPYVRRYGLWAVLAAAFMVGEVLVDLIQPRLMERIVDEGVLGLGRGGTPDLSLVWSVGVQMLLVVLVGGSCGVLSGVFTNLCGQNCGNDVRKECFSRIMHFSFEQTDAFTTGSLITRITSDVTLFQNMVQQMMRGCVRCTMFFVGGTVALSLLDVHFLRVMLVALPVLFVAVVVVVWRSGPLFDLLQRRLDGVNSIVQEDLAGARVVRAFVREDHERERFGQANERLCATQFHVLVLLSVLRPLMNIVLNLTVVAVIRIGAVQVREGSVAPGTVMAAITYCTQILNGMMMLAMIFQTISRGRTSAGRLREVLETVPAIRDGERTEGDGSVGTIVLDHVSFRYPGTRQEVLHDVNLRIRQGETLAVIGATGCGKTTLVRLLPRFYDVTAGTVLVDGVDVREYSLSALRKRIAMVLQKSELFSTTIAANIRLGNPAASDEEVREAARTAQAEGFILRQPQGYDTPVAEGGMSLSGGQRQRVAIARALLRRGEILILDDSTSALDLKTEAALQSALQEQRSGQTRIIIAQRIASVMRAGRIAVMDGGTIIACDTHEALMRSCRVYQDIYDSQLGSGGKEVRA